MNYADKIIRGASFFLGKDLPLDNEYLAIARGKIIGVGNDSNWQDYVQENTEIIELTKEDLVVPGFHDSHLHLIMAALNQNYVDLGSATSEDEAALMVRDFALTIPEEKWVIGLNWYHMSWKERKLPTAKSLDKYIPDRPVFLMNTEVHGAWANSMGLQLAGINRDTKNPEYGEIFKFENGEPSGYLNEKAMGLIGKIALKFDIEREQNLVRGILKKLSSYGITSVQDMTPELGYVLGQYETFHGLHKKGELTVRVHGADDLLGDLEGFMKAKETYFSENYRLCLLKQYLDGVPTTYTAMVVDGYSDRSGEHGAPINDLKKMQEAVYFAHKNGVSVRLHCCGDGAVRAALDFYENATKRYGDTGARHAIEHAEIIHPKDFPRFKELNVLASMQPEHMVSQIDKFEENPYLVCYNEAQMKTSWNINSLLEDGVVVAFGSDCPVVDANPITGIYRAVNRVFNDGLPVGGYNPSEKVSVIEALHCFTYNGAYAVKRENELGSLEVGKYADIAVLNKNILEINPLDIRQAKVVMTFMNGELVYKEK